MLAAFIVRMGELNELRWRYALLLQCNSLFLDQCGIFRY
jgi:hypothetical protein